MEAPCSIRLRHGALSTLRLVVAPLGRTAFKHGSADLIFPHFPEEKWKRWRPLFSLAGVPLLGADLPLGPRISSWA